VKIKLELLLRMSKICLVSANCLLRLWALWQILGVCCGAILGWGRHDDALFVQLGTETQNLGYICMDIYIYMYMDIYIYIHMDTRYQIPDRARYQIVPGT
jgi:hypothetical protein